MKWKNFDTSYKDTIDILRQKNSYERLGVAREATMNEIKTAYRRKVRLYHPDRIDVFMSNHGEEIVKLLNEAMEKIEAERSL